MLKIKTPLKQVEEEEENGEETKPVEVKPTMKYTKTEVVTQTSPAILDTKTNEAMTLEDAVVEILNKLDKIEKSVV